MSHPPHTATDGADTQSTEVTPASTTSKKITTNTTQQQTTNSHQHQLSVHPPPPPHPIITTLPLSPRTIPAFSIFDFLSTGDLLLFRTSSTISKVQRSLTSSHWDHVAMIIQRPILSKNQRNLCVLESVNKGGIKCNPLEGCIQDWRRKGLEKLEKRRKKQMANGGGGGNGNGGAITPRSSAASAAASSSTTAATSSTATSSISSSLDDPHSCFPIISIRRLNNWSPSNETLLQLEQFVDRIVGNSYSVKGLFKLGKKRIQLMFHSSSKEETHSTSTSSSSAAAAASAAAVTAESIQSSFFCSELIAACYRTAGLLPSPHSLPPSLQQNPFVSKSISEYLPGDFSTENAQIRSALDILLSIGGVSLSEEMRLDLETAGPDPSSTQSERRIQMMNSTKQTQQQAARALKRRNTTDSAKRSSGVGTQGSGGAGAGSSGSTSATAGPPMTPTNLQRKLTHDDFTSSVTSPRQQPLQRKHSISSNNGGGGVRRKNSISGNGGGGPGSEMKRKHSLSYSNSMDQPDYSSYPHSSTTSAIGSPLMKPRKQSISSNNGLPPSDDTSGSNPGHFTYAWRRKGSTDEGVSNAANTNAAAAAAAAPGSPPQQRRQSSINERDHRRKGSSDGTTSLAAAASSTVPSTPPPPVTPSRQSSQTTAAMRRKSVFTNPNAQLQISSRAARRRSRKMSVTASIAQQQMMQHQQQAMTAPSTPSAASLTASSTIAPSSLVLAGGTSPLSPSTLQRRWSNTNNNNTNTNPKPQQRGEQKESPLLSPRGIVGVIAENTSSIVTDDIPYNMTRTRADANARNSGGGVNGMSINVTASPVLGANPTPSPTSSNRGGVGGSRRRTLDTSTSSVDTPIFHHSSGSGVGPTSPILRPARTPTQASSGSRMDLVRGSSIGSVGSISSTGSGGSGGGNSNSRQNRRKSKRASQILVTSPLGGSINILNSQSASKQQQQQASSSAHAASAGTQQDFLTPATTPYSASSGSDGLTGASSNSGAGDSSHSRLQSLSSNDEGDRSPRVVEINRDITSPSPVSPLPPPALPFQTMRTVTIHTEAETTTSATTSKNSTTTTTTTTTSTTSTAASPAVTPRAAAVSTTTAAAATTTATATAGSSSTTPSPASLPLQRAPSKSMSKIQQLMGAGAPNVETHHTTAASSSAALHAHHAHAQSVSTVTPAGHAIHTGVTPHHAPALSASMSTGLLRPQSAYATLPMPLTSGGGGSGGSGGGSAASAAARNKSHAKLKALLGASPPSNFHTSSVPNLLAISRTMPAPMTQTQLAQQQQSQQQPNTSVPQVNTQTKLDSPVHTHYVISPTNSSTTPSSSTSPAPTLRPFGGAGIPIQQPQQQPQLRQSKGNMSKIRAMMGETPAGAQSLLSQFVAPSGNAQRGSAIVTSSNSNRVATTPPQPSSFSLPASATTGSVLGGGGSSAEEDIFLNGRGASSSTSQRILAASDPHHPTATTLVPSPMILSTSPAVVQVSSTDSQTGVLIDKIDLVEDFIPRA